MPYVEGLIYVHAFIPVTNIISLNGLAFDISGAVILAMGLIAKTPEQMSRESSSPFGGFNSVLLKSIVESQNDTFIGVIYFIAGFLLQSTSYWLNTDIECSSVWIFSSLVSLCLAFLIRLLLKDSLFKKQYRKAIAPRLKQNFEQEAVPQDIESLGEKLCCPRNNNEHDDEYWIRLRKIYTKSC